MGAEGITCGLEWTVPCESPLSVPDDMPFVLGFPKTSDYALMFMPSHLRGSFILELEEPLPLNSKASH